MNALILDTCTERGFFALFKNEVLFLYKQLPFGLQNAQTLLLELSDALKENDFNLQQLDFIAAGVGPGSYTGIRIGAMAAKTLSYALSIPLIGISTLEIFIPKREGKFAVLIDAKISGVYLQIGEKKENAIFTSSPPEVYAIENAHKRLPLSSVLVTPNAAQLRDKFDKIFPTTTLFWEETWPSAERMYALAYKKFQQKEYSLDGTMDLLYMRKTQAELERALL